MFKIKEYYKMVDNKKYCQREWKEQLNKPKPIQSF